MFWVTDTYYFALQYQQHNSLLVRFALSLILCIQCGDVRLHDGCTLAKAGVSSACAYSPAAVQYIASSTCVDIVLRVFQVCQLNSYSFQEEGHAVGCFCDNKLLSSCCSTLLPGVVACLACTEGPSAPPLPMPWTGLEQWQPQVMHACVHQLHPQPLMQSRLPAQGVICMHARL